MNTGQIIPDRTALKGNMSTYCSDRDQSTALSSRMARNVVKKAVTLTFLSLLFGCDQSCDLNSALARMSDLNGKLTEDMIRTGVTPEFVRRQNILSAAMSRMVAASIRSDDDAACKIADQAEKDLR